MLFIVWFIVRRRRRFHDDDDDIKWPPTAIHHEKPGPGGAVLDEPSTVPTPFNPYQYSAVAAGSALDTPGVAGGGIGHYPPSSPSTNFPNPWGNASSTGEGASRLGVPPAPTSEGSAYSGTAISSGDHGGVQPHPMLQVRNPNPSAPMGDIKDRTVFLSPDRGLQVYGGESAASGSAPTAAPTTGFGPSGVPPSTAAIIEGNSAGSASEPFVHQDAGAIPGQQGPRRRKSPEARQDTSEPQEIPPPAYEE